MSDLGNTPEFSVSEIAGAIRHTLEGSFGRVRVRGEITELRGAAASGHLYFCLKDESAKIRGIVWRGAAQRLSLKPENGVEVIATGRISSYPERSEYQLIIERLEYAGMGALLARIEALRLKLEGEGLFAPGRKRPIPLLPGVIGVITSAQGAVLHDIKTTIARRFPRPILVWPVAVQGELAAAQIAAAITGFCRLPEAGIARPDVLIVARGGGSVEDLMAFNDEAVLRAAAACTIPLISAVGHETDTTLIDYVSDRRAPTPTAAAELAVPPRLDLLADLAQKAARLNTALSHAATAARARLDRASHLLPDLPGLLGTARQRLDDRAERLLLALPNYVSQRRAALERLAGRLIHPREFLLGQRSRVALLAHRLEAPWPARLQSRRDRIDGLWHRLETQPGARLRESRLRLEHLSARLQAVSYQAVLRRGFVLVTRPTGAPVVSAAKIKAGDALELKFHDGDVPAEALARQGSLGL